MKGPFSAYALDLTGFALGIGLAVWNGWRTADLVWGLWLSSLVLGWLSIANGAMRSPLEPGADSTTVFLSRLLVLGFFTVHFGIFHFVHSVFLTALFPLPIGPSGIKTSELQYGRVFADYWPWLLCAAVAERRMLFGKAASVGMHRAAPAATEAAPTRPRGKLASRTLPLPVFDPRSAYKNVVRMHLLIFALLPMQIAGIGDSWSYALVYAVYFWPRREKAAAAS